MNKSVGILSAVTAAIVALAAVFAPQIQDLVSTHPVVASVLGAVVTIAAALSKSVTGSQDQPK